MRSLFDVNVFGPIRVTQAILPLFRSQGHGSIAFIGAGVAWGPIAFLSHYSAAKAALDSFVEGLRKELRGQNIHSTIFEPGGFESRLGHPRSGSDEGFGKYQPVIPAYQDLFGEMMGTFVKDIIPNVPGDVLKMAAAIVDLVGSDGISGKLPIRLVLGSDAAAAIKQKCTEQLKLLSDFEDISKRTDIDDTQGLTYDGTLKLMSMLN
jgi:NAD(P)-dependent dehydrogenase (short-subunit alcohol dehydrogenase family)